MSSRSVLPVIGRILLNDLLVGCASPIRSTLR